MTEKTRHPWETREMTELFDAFSSLKSRLQLEIFLRDLCTLGELEAMAHRWKVARLVHRGVPYTEIAEQIGVSTATVTRVAHSVLAFSVSCLTFDTISSNALRFSSIAARPRAISSRASPTPSLIDWAASFTVVTMRTWHRAGRTTSSTHSPPPSPTRCG